MTPSPAGAPSGSSTTTTALLAPSRDWSPTPGEDALGPKLAATQALLALATYSPGGGTVPAASARMTTIGLPAILAAQGKALLDESAEGAITILYPQLGGLASDAASVMVVADLRTRRVGVAAQTQRRVLELHVSKGPAGWVADALRSTGGSVVTGPAPTPEIASLLGNPNVELPDTGRWDLLAGRVDSRVVALLNRLGATHRLSVTVLGTGHPANVFGTERASNHMGGRAVDIWAVDGVPVVDQRQPGSPIEGLVRQVLAGDVTELGSPFDLDGRGGAMFTDLVHHDHLHLGYRG